MVRRSDIAGLSVARLAILGLVETIHAIASSSAGVASIVRRAHGVVGTCTSSRHLSITGVDLLVALPEWTLAGT